MQFPEMEQKMPKKILVCKIIALELGSTSSLILEQDTGHWQSICYQATLKFKISLSEVYSNAGSLRVLKNLIKMLSWRYYKSLGRFNIFTGKGCSETAFFREWSHQVFDSL